MTKSVRCSALPRIMKCPASAVEPEIVIDSSSDAARLGTAVHAVLADVVRGDLVTLPEDWMETIESYDVDVDEARILCYCGVKLWKKIRDSLEFPSAECAHERDGITGTPDVYGKVAGKEKEFFVLDWKTGVDADHTDQLKGYAWLVGGGSEHSAKLITCYLREQVIEVVDVTWEELQQWREGLQSALESPNIYNPGTWCQYCPMATDCGARSALVRASAADLSAIDYNGKELTPELLAGLWDRSKMLEKALDQYKKTVRMLVEENGSLSLGDGRELRLESRRKTNIDLMKALGPIGTHFDANDLASLLDIIGETLSISKSKLMKIVADYAPKGVTKKDAKEGFMQTLLDSGAAFEFSYKTMQARKEK